MEAIRSSGLSFGRGIDFIPPRSFFGTSDGSVSLSASGSVPGHSITMICLFRLRDSLKKERAYLVPVTVSLSILQLERAGAEENDPMSPPVGAYGLVQQGPGGGGVCDRKRVSLMYRGEVSQPRHVNIAIQAYELL